MEQDARFAEARYYLAAVLHQQGDLEGALEEFREAVRLNPDYREAHFGMGVVLRKLGKREEAEAEFRQVEALQEISTRIQAAKQSNDSGYDLWSHGKT